MTSIRAQYPNTEQKSFLLLLYTNCLTEKQHICHSSYRMVVGLQLPTQSVPITTDIVISNLDQGEVYNIMW
jgi:hypothetical protein